MSSGRITAIEVQQRDQERVSIFLDEEFAFGLNRLDAVRLRVGQSLTEAEIAQLRDKDAVSHAMDAAFRYLASRPRSTAEIATQLKKKKYEPAIISQVIGRLVELGYADDRQFAHYWIENRNEFSQRGEHALRYELRQKGIPDTIIEEILAQLDYEELARLAAKKKLRTFRGIDAKSARTRLSGFLSRRGFDYDTVRRITEELIATEMDGNPYEE